MKKLRLFFIFALIAFILSACSDDNNGIPEPKPTVKNRMTSFKFETSKNDIQSELTGKFNTDSTVITITTKQWIGNINALIPTFKATGTVKVKNIEQTTGVTANDFQEEGVVYSVYLDDVNKRDYKVVIKSPQTSGLPVINVKTENNKPITDKENYVTATVKVTTDNPDHSFENKPAGIRGRGNSTWNYPKKPYRIKFDSRTSLFGYGAAKSWVLLANYLDPTLIMNSVAFELGQRFGLEYTNHANHVEFFLNGSYQGSYVLTEQVQVDKQRVNIDEEKDFLVELDTYFDEDYQFKTSIIQLPVMIKSPELTNDAGMDFVKTAMKDLEDALFDPVKNFPDNNYQDLIDINTVINFLMVNDIVANTELQHPKSMYMYKRASGKIQMGPLWDFDWGFGGNGSFHYFEDREILCQPNYTGSQTGYKFFCRFFDDPDFRKKYKDRWNELYQTKISNMDVFIDELTAKLQKSQIENFEVWSNNLDYNVQINSMKTWLKTRIQKMNTEINKY